MIKDLRESKQLSQGKLAARLTEVSGIVIGRERISRWERPVERGGVIPSDFWLGHLAHTLDAPFSVLESEANLTRMNRRGFLGLTALVATHGKTASEVTACIAGGDFGSLTTIQTSHNTDLVIASKVDRPSTVKLQQWMHGGADPVLRVNAAGILAKVPGQEPADEVVKVLTHDPETRHLYMAAVASRVCGLDWTAARRLAKDPRSMPQKAPFLAARFAEEVTNPSDAGARWCSAVMLRDLSPLLGR
jgi:transcriptional regulator with XRE-family HTH domain